MKILQLRFKNLNSLAGEWLIDFTAPGYLSDGIFAISGPTGSGKSTILDAICLALYGQTPRLGKITNTSNEIMSRQTGDCYAEVVFQASNREFICCWSQQRARKKAGGTLQQPRHEISDSETGQILAEKLTDVKAEVEECTGMDFTRFTQSMMLAQGGFAVFLKAGPAERAPILEQITGTEIYSNISKQVHERQRAEKEQLERLKSGLAGFVILSHEDELALEQELTDCRNKAEKLEEQKSKLVKSVEWLTGINTLQDELSSLSEEEKSHAHALAEFEPRRQILGRGLKAAALDGQYVELTGLRKIQQEDLNKLNMLDEKLPGSEEKLRNSSELLDKKRKTYQLAILEKEAGLKIIREVREKDQMIALKRDNFQSARLKFEQTEKEIAREKSKKKAFENSVHTLNADLSCIKQFLLYNEADARLVPELAGIKEQINSLKEAFANLDKANIAVREAEAKLNMAEKQHKALEESRDKLQLAHTGLIENTAKLQKEKMTLLGDRTLTSLQSEIGKLYLKLAKLQKIADLESERAQLSDNVPCPLCGSLHHPWARGNVPDISETERKLQEMTTLMAKAEIFETQLNNAVLKESEAVNQLNKAVHNLDLSGQNFENLRGRVREFQETGKSCTAVVEKKIASLLQRVIPLGIQEIPGNGFLLDKLLHTLEERKNSLEQNLEKKKILEEKINDLKTSITGSEATLEALIRDIAVQQREISLKADEIEGLVSAREEIYGTRNTGEEERKFNEQAECAEKQKEAAEKVYNQFNLEFNALKTSINTLKQNTEERSIDLMSKESDLLVVLSREGFAGEDDFAECRLSREELERLNGERNELDSGSSDIQSRKKEREKRLEDERAKNITAASLDELRSGLAETNAELTAIFQKTGALLERKEANESARTRNLQLKREIEFQQAVYTRWYSLHALIGSADGKKFRNFAQGITFELMVSHANRQLNRLSDRYLLIRDAQEPLELNVVDNYQAGEVRTTKNLSGGESFIVSLALALGLSLMSGRKARVDSLFLDEGFGTLDEEALDTALETLAGLRQEGKLIGVISHVAAFRDRINTRITVQPARGGKSVISGPGVSKNISA